MEKAIRKYGNVYRKALLFRHYREIEAKTAAYETRLRAMYASDGFKAHSVYPTTNAVHVYAVITMCMELKAFGLTDTEIIETINHGFAHRRNFFRRIIRAIDLLPNSFSIAKKWNIQDHDRRVKDGSITYDRFDVGKDRIMFYFAGILFSRARIDTDLREQICQQFMPLIDFLRDGQPGISESNMVVFVNGDISVILKVSHGDRNGRLCY